MLNKKEKPDIFNMFSRDRIDVLRELFMNIQIECVLNCTGHIDISGAWNKRFGR